MKRIYHTTLLLIGSMCVMIGAVHAQELRGVMLTLTVDNEIGRTQDLTVGILEGATTGIDQSFGETELPPQPPTEIFDARLASTPGKSSLGTGSLSDFRPANPATTTYTETYTIAYQGGLNATKIKLTWQSPLPGRVTKLVVEGSDVTTKSEVEVSFPTGQLTVVVTYNYSPLSFTAVPVSLSFDANNKDPLPSQTIDIIPQGDPTAQWVLSADAGWIDPDMGSGEGRQTVTVSVNIGLVPTGTYNGILTVRSPLYPAQLDIPVTLHYTLGVNDAQIPSDIILTQNFPNPCSGNAVIGVQIGAHTNAAPRLSIADMSGRVVLDLTSRLVREPGMQQLSVDTRSLPEGAYTYTMRVDGYELSRTMIVVK